jgi:hypothetical protein
MHVHFIKNFVCTRQSKSEVEAGRVVSESKTAQAAESEDSCVDQKSLSGKTKAQLDWDALCSWAEPNPVERKRNLKKKDESLAGA